MKALLILTSVVLLVSGAYIAGRLRGLSQALDNW